jgi:hypothetical protein
MTTANGSSAACDFSQFNGSITATAPDDNPISLEAVTTFRSFYSIQGTRHAARIATAEANYSWSEDSVGSIISLGTKVDDTVPATGVAMGTAVVTVSYNDGGYNDSGAPSFEIEVTK